MLCPACGHKLQEIQIDDFIYHICKDSCGGILIGNSEIEKFFSQTENIIQKIICVKSKTSAFYQNKLCPECSKNQMKNHYRNGFEVSNCPECKNLWLDIDELNKIREKYDVETEAVEKTVDETVDKIPAIKETTILPVDSVDDKITSDFKETNRNKQKISETTEKNRTNEITEKTDTLLCPACGHQLEKVQADNFIYHICQNGCGGILIDHSEADKFIEQTENITTRILNVECNKSIMYVSSVNRYCPDCNRKKMRPCKKNGFEISECPVCKNIWLDSNEICRAKEKYKTGNTTSNIISRLLCPACGQKLYAAEINGFVCHICRDGCGGVLIDNTVLRKIIDSPKIISDEVLNIKINKSKLNKTSKIRTCPRCENQKMVRKFRNDVEIDECYRCGSVWLDHGEFIALYKEHKATKKHKKAGRENFYKKKDLPRQKIKTSIQKTLPPKITKRKKMSALLVVTLSFTIPCLIFILLCVSWASNIANSPGAGWGGGIAVMLPIAIIIIIIIFLVLFLIVIFIIFIIKIIHKKKKR